jgi:hypothetical protein
MSTRFLNTATRKLTSGVGRMNSFMRTTARCFGIGPKKIMNNNIGTLAEQCGKFERFSELVDKIKKKDVLNKNKELQTLIDLLKTDQRHFQAASEMLEHSSNPGKFGKSYLDMFSNNKPEAQRLLSEISDDDMPKNGAYVDIKQELRNFIPVMYGVYIQQIKALMEQFDHSVVYGGGRLNSKVRNLRNTLARKYRSSKRTLRRRLGKGPNKIKNSTQIQQDSKFQRFRELYNEYINDSYPDARLLMILLDSDIKSFHLIPNKHANTYINQYDIYTLMETFKINQQKALEFLKHIPSTPKYYTDFKNEMAMFIPFMYQLYNDILTARLQDIIETETYGPAYRNAQKLPPIANYSTNIANTFSNNASDTSNNFSNNASDESTNSNNSFNRRHPMKNIVTRTNFNFNSNSNSNSNLSVTKLDPYAYTREPKTE